MEEDIISIPSALSCPDIADTRDEVATNKGMRSAVVYNYSVAPCVGLSMLGPPLGAWLHALTSTPELVSELEGISLNLLNPIFEITFFLAMALKLI